MSIPCQQKPLFNFSAVNTFFLSRIEPRPKTDILHIVSSCSRFKLLPFGPRSFPTKLNYTQIKKGFLTYQNCDLKITFGWSRTGTATRTVTFMGLSRVMSIILPFSYECGTVDGEPARIIIKKLVSVNLSRWSYAYKAFFLRSKQPRNLWCRKLKNCATNEPWITTILVDSSFSKEIEELRD